MSDAEKIIIGAAIVGLFGLVIWLIQANFNDLKKRLEEISGKMVTTDICLERHRTINDRLKAHAEAIKRLEEEGHG
jgi:hypothetical protein